MRRWPPLSALVAGVATSMIAGLGSAGAAFAERPAALRLSVASFAQQDWMTTDRTTVVRDTRWGVFEYRYPRVADRTRYLSLLVTAGNHRAWPIKNLPVFPEVGNSPGPESVHATTFFDLSELGVRAGERLKTLCFAAELSFDARRSPPVAAMRCRRVRSERYLAGDDPSMAPSGSFRAGIGAPAPIRYRASEAVAVRRLGGGPEPALPLENLGSNRLPYNGVQEGDRQCMAGAIARSLDWLNRQYEFGVELSAQELYAGLRDAGATRTPEAQGISAQPNAVPRGVGLRLAAKMRYVNDVFGPGRIETKVWDAASGAANGGNVHTNLPKSSPNSQNPEDFDAWLIREWQAGEDVELAWISPRSAHIVTLTEVAVDADGNFKVKYREDRGQGSSKRGDVGPTDGTIFRGKIGEKPGGSPLMGWRFGDAKNDPKHVVKYAIAESPTDEFRPG